MGHCIMDGGIQGQLSLSQPAAHFQDGPGPALLSGQILYAAGLEKQDALSAMAWHDK